jgi:hypothetical protein
MRTYASLFIGFLLFNSLSKACCFCCDSSDNESEEDYYVVGGGGPVKKLPTRALLSSPADPLPPSYGATSLQQLLQQTDAFTRRDDANDNSLISADNKYRLVSWGPHPDDSEDESTEEETPGFENPSKKSSEEENYVVIPQGGPRKKLPWYKRLSHLPPTKLEV